MTQCHDSYESDLLAAAHLPVLVRDVMTAPAITVGPAAAVKEIAHVLLSHDIRAVPVVDVGEIVVGIVSESDVICRECPTARRHTLGGLVDRVLGHGEGWAEKAEGITAEEIMSTELVSCSPLDPVSAAARMMLSDQVRVVPVVEDGRLVGVLSRHDVLRVFDRPDSEIRARIGWWLTDSRRSPEGHQVEARVLDGVVTVTGSVRYPSDAWVVVSSISEIPGVIEVRNHLAADLPDPLIGKVAAGQPASGT